MEQSPKYFLLHLTLSDLVLIYSRQLQNVQSFDPSGATSFHMEKKGEVDLSYKKKKRKKSKKIFYYGLERVIYTGKPFSVAEKRDEVKPHCHLRMGLSAGGPLG